jgi:iron only hydrogenase large subunit-like protein
VSERDAIVKWALDRGLFIIADEIYDQLVYEPNKPSSIIVWWKQYPDRIAVVNGLANAKKLLKEIDEGKKFYHLIEVMTCQGGCVGGAGQPYGLKKSKEKRSDGLHLSDNAAMFKRAERNPVVAQMMAEYGEERCHELLHVTYTNK